MTPEELQKEFIRVSIERDELAARLAKTRAGLVTIKEEIVKLVEQTADSLAAEYELGWVEACAAVTQSIAADADPAIVAKVHEVGKKFS